MLKAHHALPTTLPAATVGSVKGGSDVRKPLVFASTAAVVIPVVLAGQASAGFAGKDVLYKSQYANYSETTSSSWASASNETGNNTGANTTYGELLAVSVQCNGYGQNCITHAASRIYPTIYNGSYRTVDAGNPYSFGHTYKACISTKTRFSNTYYNWDYLNQCTQLTT